MIEDVKQLYLVRHGKSDWGGGDIKDIDRSLKERGIYDGYTMAGYLNSKGIMPEKIITSPANRALHTATIFARVFNLPDNKIFIKNEMYLSEVKALLDIIKNTEDNVGTLMIFGHNPTFTELANYFLNDIFDIPTTGVVGIKFESKSWVNIDQLKPTDSFFNYPKKLNK